MVVKKISLMIMFWANTQNIEKWVENNWIWGLILLSFSSKLMRLKLDLKFLCHFLLCVLNTIHCFDYNVTSVLTLWGYCKLKIKNLFFNPFSFRYRITVSTFQVHRFCQLLKIANLQFSWKIYAQIILVISPTYLSLKCC